jgi:hypothetical protein
VKTKHDGVRAKLKGLEQNTTAVLGRQQNTLGLGGDINSAICANGRAVVHYPIDNPICLQKL